MTQRHWRVFSCLCLCSKPVWRS